MKAEDTVMGSEEFKELQADGNVWRPIRHQAKITWDIALKAGIREVVQFKCDDCSTSNFVHLVVPKAKLKEWGVE